MKRAAAVFLLMLPACVSEEVVYRPRPALLPPHIRSLGVAPALNFTPYPGLESKFTLRLIEEFQRDGRFSISAPEQADGVVVTEIRRYILQPLSYDQNLIPKEYKLTVLVDLSFFDKKNQAYLWKESNLEGAHRYLASTEPGGITEEAAREIIWDKLARLVLRRTIEGFGSVTGTSERKISTETSTISR